MASSEADQPGTASAYTSLHSARDPSAFGDQEAARVAEPVERVLASAELRSRKPPSHGGSQLGAARPSQAHDGLDSDPLDSVLGDIDRDVLLKNVIQKCEFNSRRLEELHEKLVDDLARHKEDQSKVTDHLLEADTTLQSLMSGYNQEADEKIKSQASAVKLLREDLGFLGELVRMGRGGRLLGQLEDHIKEAVDKGPLAELRDLYAPRAQVEKDIMKVQNSLRKLQDEQQHLGQMRAQLNERIDLLQDVYLPVKHWESEMKQYALTKQVDEVKKKIEQCARQTKTVQQFERLDGLIEALTRRMGTDFPTFAQVNAKVRDLGQTLQMDLLPKAMFKERNHAVDARLEAINDLTQNCKTAIKSHTKHITQLKKEMETKAQKRNLDEIVVQLKKFALNEDYK